MMATSSVLQDLSEDDSFRDSAHTYADDNSNDKMDFLYHDFNVIESFGETVSAKYTIGALKSIIYPSAKKGLMVVFSQQKLKSEFLVEE